MRRNYLSTTIFGLAALAAAPAFAQGQTAGRAGQTTGACGQTVSLTYSVGQPIDVTPVSPLAMNFVRGEPLYLEFQIASDTRLVARTTTENPEDDTHLTLYGSDQNAITRDDDSAGGYDAMIDTDLSPGTYCLQVGPYSLSSANSIVTTLTVATGDAAGELAATATNVEPGGVDYARLCQDPALTSDLGRNVGPGFGTEEFTATLSGDPRQDWRFTVDTQMPLQIDASSGEFDTVLTLVDANGNYIDENDDGPVNTDSELVVNLPAGEYCLSLSAYEGSARGQAILKISDDVENPPAGPVTTACTDPEITQDFGMSIAPGIGSQSRPLDVARRSRNDFQIEVTEAVELQIDSKSGNFDTVLHIVDQNGNILDENDDGPLNTDSRITRTLSPGRYCLAVSGYSNEGGTGELIVSDDPEPDPVDPSTIAACSDPAMTADLGTAINESMSPLSVPMDLAPNTRMDWRMEVSEQVDLRIDASSQNFDTVLRLFDGNGGYVDENDDGPIGTDSRINRSLAPGSYCVTVEGFAGGGGAGQLSLALAGTVVDTPTPAGRLEPLPEASLIEELGTLEASLQSSAMTPEQNRWVAFDLTSHGSVRVDAVSASGGFTLLLLSEAGEVLGEASGSDGLTPTALSAALLPGRYIVAMKMNDGVEARLRNIVITLE